MPILQEPLQHKTLGIGKTQPCPFCGMQQEIFIPGLKLPTGEKYMQVVEGKGYSFCNCRNIFFTSWDNINQKAYDQDYSKKYNNSGLQDALTKYAKEFIPKFGPGKDRVFVEMGSAYPFILDEAKRSGFATCGVDINSHYDFLKEHGMIVGDLDNDVVIESTPPCDVVWASHVIEHLHYPVSFCHNIYQLLNPGGYFFVAMPDPFFIPWENPKLWSHWVVEEHHILWDMDSFIDAMLDLGFELVSSNRNLGFNYGNLSGDFQVILRKP